MARMGGWVRLAALAAASTLAWSVAWTGAARAVVILDSVWQDAGGSEDNEAAGFGWHIALANEPQFDSLMTLSEDDGETWGSASATWIGNDGDHGYVLTAGHNFDEDYAPDDYLYRSRGGTVYEGEALFVHPFWNGKSDERGGYDLAIVRLSARVTDAGEAPVLYAGRAELGLIATMVGYGSRGIGSAGEAEEFYDGDDKAAAENRIDAVAEEVWPLPEEPDEDAGNHLGVDFDAEDGSAESDLDGDPFPASDFEGLLGSGDSGGSLWARFGHAWRIIGVNVNGTGDRYGEESYFARISTQTDWIRAIFPDARFAGD